MKAAVVTGFTQPLEIQDRPVPTPGPRRGAGAHRGQRTLSHRHPRGPRGLARQAHPAVRPGPRGRRHRRGPRRRRHPPRRSATVSRCRGSVTHAGTAPTASAAGRRCASRSRTPATRSTAASPSTPSPTPTTSSPSPTASTRGTPRRSRCAGVTTYKAVKVAHIQPTEKVAIFGIGGLGHLAVQYATIVGGTVIAVDVDDAKLEMARELGADHVINAGTTDPVAAIEALGGCDVAIVLAVIPHVFESAFASLRRGGRLVCVGLPPETDGPMSLPIFPTVLKGISVIGSIVGTRQDLTEVFALHALGRTRVVAGVAQARRGQRGDRRRAQRPRHRASRVRVLSLTGVGRRPLVARRLQQGVVRV